jgi:hypothetical protein
MRRPQRKLKLRSSLDRGKLLQQQYGLDRNEKVTAAHKSWNWASKIFQAFASELRSFAFNLLCTICCC